MGVMYIVLYLMNLINCRGSCACFFSRPSSFLLLSKTRITPSPTLKSHVISPVWILEFDSEKYHPQLCLTRERSLETPNGAEHLEGAAGAENFLVAVTTAGKGKILPRRPRQRRRPRSSKGVHPNASGLAAASRPLNTGRGTAELVHSRGGVI